MAAKMGLPVLKLAKERGVEVVIIAEGKAIGVCGEAGFPLAITGSDKLKPYGEKATKSVLGTLKPDVVLVGCSTPINWELEFAEAAQAMGIPVVACEDIWGALSRLRGFKPDLALVMDTFTRRYAISEKFAIIGDIASVVNTSVPDTEISQAALKTFWQTTDGKTSIMMVADDPRNVLEVTELLTSCLRLEPDPNRFAVYYSLWHPKYADAGKYPEYAHVLPEFARLTEGLTFYHRGALSTDALAARCDITAGGYTTPLRIAIHHGKRAISLWGPIVDGLHRAECQLATYPLAEMGVVPTLTEPRPFSSFDWAKYDTTGQQWAEQTKFRPEVGAEAIRLLVRK